MSRRRELTKQLELLTPDQLGMFKLCFGTTVAADVKRADLKNATRLCAATIKDIRGSVLDVIAQRHEPNGCSRCGVANASWMRPVMCLCGAPLHYDKDGKVIPEP